MPFVIDASVALASCFEDERSEYTDAVLRALSTGELAYAPAIWPLEVLNGLLVAERRKRLKREDVNQVIRFLESFVIDLDDLGSLSLYGEDLRLARQGALSVYDASYIGLAQRRGLALATVDKRLAAAAQNFGIRVFRSSEQ